MLTKFPEEILIIRNRITFNHPSSIVINIRKFALIFCNFTIPTPLIDIHTDREDETDFSTR